MKVTRLVRRGPGWAPPLLDTHDYPTSIKITDEQMKDLNLSKHDFHGADWNYTLEPRTTP